MSEKKEGLNWTLIGQVIAICVSLYTTIKDVFAELRVGPEILEWLNSEGKEFFTRKLEEAGKKFQQSKGIFRDVIDFDLKQKWDNYPCLRNDDPGSYLVGETTIRKIKGKVYVGDDELAICEITQDNIKEIMDQRNFKYLLPNANLYHFLVNNPEFYPEDWKIDCSRVCFCGSVYLATLDLLGTFHSVRCCYFWQGEVREDSFMVQTDNKSFGPNPCGKYYAAYLKPVNGRIA